MLDAITVQAASENASILTLIYTVLLAFILSSILGIVYQKTLAGQDYSKTYIQSVILISLISAVIIQAVGDSLARGLGIMAAMAIIRFRTNLKDSRDLIFLFASLAAGISCGSYAFDIAIVGTLAFVIAAIILSFTPLGEAKETVCTLSFNLAIKNKEKHYLDKFIEDYCNSSMLTTVADIDDHLSYVYKIKLKSDRSYENFMMDLKRLPSIKNIKLKLQQGN